jgi:O-acetyl-ADP-ribose deacetylase (regulator of RNase III)
VIFVGDLVDQSVDAIVNAANNDLLLGGGVAGAIRRRGGPDIERACELHGPVRVGEAAITGAGALPASHVIHAASMSLGGRTTTQSLTSSMCHAFRLARVHGVRTIAVPAVGTGVAGYPIADCACVMAVCLRRALADGWRPDEVRFVLYDEAAKRAFEATFRTAFEARPDAGS